jgi:hypothetical protein
MAIIPVQQPLTDIVFAKATEANLAIAKTPTGAGTLTDVIAPVTFASGVISATSGQANVTGTGTNFENDFAQGDFLFYYDLYTAAPTLLGQIESIGSPTLITLTEDVPTTIQNLPSGKANIVLSPTDTILMRIGMAPISGGNFFLPNWNQWVSPNSYGQPNNENTNFLEQISLANAPETPAVSPTNIPYTITPVFGWEINATTQTYFPTNATVPGFVYAQLIPNSGSSVAANTLFRLFASASFEANCIRASLNYPKSDLVLAGYFAN